MIRKGDGLYLRGTVWYLDFRHRGKRHREPLGSDISRTVARELATIKRAQILKGEAGIGRKKADIAFTEAAKLFRDWAEANRKPNTVKCYGEFLTQLEKFFNGKKLSGIHPFLIEKYKQRRLKENAKVSVNRELSLLKNLFNRCIGWKKFEGQNPVCEVQFVKETRGRKRFLTFDEEDRLLAAAPELTRTIILVGIYTGLRVNSEALTLKKVDIDLRGRLLTVQAAHAKNGVTKTVPIHPDLVEPLRTQMERSKCEWVFVKQKDEFSRLRSNRTSFDRACRRAKLTGVTPHVLRHTFASRLGMAGTDLRTIQELGGWRSIKMVERYAHLSDEHKRAAIEGLSRGRMDTVFPTSQNSDNSESLQVVGK